MNIESSEKWVLRTMFTSTRKFVAGGLLLLDFREGGSVFHEKQDTKVEA
jgi:hypothetical protein